MPPDGVTLWHLPEEVEEQFDAQWENWLDAAAEWAALFEAIESVGGNDLVSLLRQFDLVDAPDIEAYSALRRSLEGRAVALPKPFAGTRQDLALLALGFARGEPGALAVPYAKRQMHDLAH